jgi:PDZ domain-containing secreted protein
MSWDVTALRASGRAAAAAVTAVAVVLGPLTAVVWIRDPSPYVTMTAGPVAELPTRPADGATGAQLVGAWLAPTVHLVALSRIAATRARLTGTTLHDTRDGVLAADPRTANRVDLLHSARTAAAYAHAVRDTGPDASATGDGMLVVHADPASPLHPGDIVTHVDGRPVTTHAQLAAVSVPRRWSVRGSATGSFVFVVAPGSAPATRTLPALPPDDLGAALAPAHVTGGSAGLAAALAALDLTGPGALTGGMRVAATGTIDAHGTVGHVTGVAAKLDAVTAARADVMFVPSGTASARPAGALEVVEVSSVLDAVRWLCAHGGSDPLC